MYELLLTLHSYLRWIFLALATWLLTQYLIKYLRQLSYSKLDDLIGTSLIGTLHLQLILGIVLYFFLSPITTSTPTRRMDQTQRHPLLPTRTPTIYAHSYSFCADRAYSYSKSRNRQKKTGHWSSILRSKLSTHPSQCPMEQIND